jgi:hypothetical protein
VATRPITLPCQAERLTGWLNQHGAYGGDNGYQPFDTSVYDDEVNWIVNGKPSRKTRREIAKEEDDFRRLYPVQKYAPKTLSVAAVGEQCVLTQQLDSYKQRSNGRSERGTFKVTFFIRTDANGPRSIVGHEIEVLPSRQ